MDDEIKDTAIIDDLDSNFSIDLYVKFKRSGRWDIPIDQFLGYADLNNEYFKGIGIDIDIITTGASDPDIGEIDEICLLVLEKIIERKTLEDSGESHLQGRKRVITDSQIDYLIVLLLEHCLYRSVATPTSLVVLIRERLGGTNLKFHKKSLQENQKIKAAFVLAWNQNMTCRRLSEKTSYHFSTISRWMKDPNFIKYVEEYNELISEEK